MATPTVKIRISVIICACLTVCVSQAQTPLPTPTAAGRTVVKPAPGPNAIEEIEDPETDETEPTSRLGEDLPEPFLCEFTQVSSAKGRGRRWENTGSEYPRIVPPVTKSETLSNAFTRSAAGGRGPSWGLCSEIAPGLKDGVLSVTLFAHVSKVKTSPADDDGRCRWTSDSKRRVGNREIRLRQGEYGGIEFKNERGESIRFSVHWPTKTDSDTSGELCRQLATEMSLPEFIHSKFSPIKL